METTRIDGYLSRTLTIYYLNGATKEFKLHIVKPISPEIENPQSGVVTRLRIFMSGFEIIPFKAEIPYIIFIDTPIILREITNGRYLLSSQD